MVAPRSRQIETVADLIDQIRSTDQRTNFSIRQILKLRLFVSDMVSMKGPTKAVCRPYESFDLATRLFCIELTNIPMWEVSWYPPHLIFAGIEDPTPPSLLTSQ